MKVPRLDEEVFQMVEMRHKISDQSFQSIQKAVLASMSALSGLMDLGFRRGAQDPELDELGKNLMDSLQLHAFMHNTLISKRKEQLKPELAPAYARELSKGKASTPDWLYGGDLVDATKKCEAAKRLGEKIVRKRGGGQCIGHL